MAIEDVVFYSQGNTLRGSLVLPDTTGPHPLLIVTHTSHAGTREFGAYQHLARVLPAMGVAVLLFDRRGSGQSTGDFAAATFFDLAADVLAAIELIKTRGDIDALRIGVWGLSQGGWIAPLAATLAPDVAFVVAVSSAGVSPAEQMNYSAVYALREAGCAEATLLQMLELRVQVDAYYRGQADFAPVQAQIDRFKDESWFKLAYMDETLPADPTVSKWRQEMDFDPCEMMRAVHVPLLLLYAEIDPWVPIKESIARWAANGPKSITARQINDANHFMVSIARAGLRASEGPQVEEYTALLTHWIHQQVG